jgi:hypothetical protein
VPDDYDDVVTQASELRAQRRRIWAREHPGEDVPFQLPASTLAPGGSDGTYSESPPGYAEIRVRLSAWFADRRKER